MVGVSVWNAWVGGVGQNEGKEGPSAECAVGAVGNFRAFRTLKRIVSKIIRGERQLGGVSIQDELSTETSGPSCTANKESLHSKEQGRKADKRVCLEEPQTGNKLQV